MRVFLLASFVFFALCQQKRPVSQGQQTSVRFAPFDALRMHNQVESALESVRQLLNNTRNPAFPTQIPHLYEDKFLLAEVLTNTEMAAQLNALEAMGLARTSFGVLSNWASEFSQTVNLGFRGTKSCSLVRSESKDSASSPRGVEQISTAVTEYVWSLLINWEITTFNGPSRDAKSLLSLQLESRNASFELRTTTNQPPSVCAGAMPTLNVDITWLFAHVGPRGRPNFTIDRTLPSTFTPSRNRPIQDALEFFQRLFDWSARVEALFLTQIFPLHTSNVLPAVSTEDLFVPVIPFLEEDSNRCNVENATTCIPEVTLNAADLNVLLREQQASLQRKAELLAKSFPVSSARTPVSSSEARVVVLLRHLRQLAQAYSDSITSIEAMLHAQLVAAIGQQIKSSDLIPFMDFNYNLLYKSEFKPQDMSISVRRPGHHPEGAVAIERMDGQSTVARPVKMVTRSINTTTPMSMSIDGTTLSLVGKRFVHGSVFHQFSDQAPPRLQLKARALQFASFVLVVGTLIGENEFQPESACIVLNKDEVVIPLLLNPILTPQAFRAAVASLSPEQREFANRVREMQLSSIVFAFAIIQIKPHLETILKLPPESLTKEVLLIPAVMQLILDFQIPSDQLSYSGDMNASQEMQINFVTNQVTEVTVELQKIEAAARAQEAMRQYTIQPLPGEYMDYDYEPHMPTNQQPPGVMRRQAAPPRTAPAPTILPAPLLRPLFVPPGTWPVQAPTAANAGPPSVRLNAPTGKATFAPSGTPTAVPSGKAKATAAPTAKAKAKATAVPTQLPTGAPTVITFLPTAKPSAKSTPAPTAVEIDPGKGKAAPSVEIDPGKGKASIEVNPGKGKMPGKAKGKGKGKPEPKVVLPTATTPRAPSAVTPGQAANDGLDDLLPLLMLPLLAAVNPPTTRAPPPPSPVSASTSSPLPQRPSIVLASASDSDDFTLVPKEITSRLEALDERTSRFVMIQPGAVWTQTVHTGLLAAPDVLPLRAPEQDLLRKKAYDLLDALSKFGALTLEAEVHTVFATTQYFDKSLLESVIQANENPIASLERSSLILSSTLLNRPVADLLASGQVARVRAENPTLFPRASNS